MLLRLGCIGFGQMGSAFLKGILNNIPPEEEEEAITSRPIFSQLWVSTPNSTFDTSWLNNYSSADGAVNCADNKAAKASALDNKAGASALDNKAGASALDDKAAGTSALDNKAGTSALDNKAGASALDNKAAGTSALDGVVVKCIRDNSEAVMNSDILLLALPSQVLPIVIDELTPQARQRLFTDQILVISLMASFSVAQLTKVCGTTRIIRLMPNTPVQINTGSIALFSNPQDDATYSQQKEDLQIAYSLCQHLGRFWQLQDEKLFDLFSATIGTGPAFLYTLMESLTIAIVATIGHNWHDARDIATQMVSGTAKYLHQKKDASQSFESQFSNDPVAHQILTEGRDTIKKQRKSFLTADLTMHLPSRRRHTNLYHQDRKANAVTEALTNRPKH